MPRPKRICQPDLTYHVYSRFIDRNSFMDDDFFKDIMIGVIERCQNKYTFDLIAYEIMDNHFHLIIKTVENGEPISRIIQYIKSRFAETVNKLLKREGAVWSERFKDKIVEMQDNPVIYFITLIWYLAYNPIKKSFCSKPEEYKYGSINFLLDNNYKNKLKLTFHKIYLMLGESFDARKTILLNFRAENYQQL